MPSPSALANFSPPILKLPELSAGPYVAEARRRLERLAAVDFTAPLSRRRALFSARWAEARRWRLAEAWKRTQADVQAFERQLREQAAAVGRYRPSAPRSLELFRAALLTQYCAHILRYQAALGQRPGAPARTVPVEWMQMAAAAAVLSVLQTALMLWVLHQPARRRARAVRRHRRALPLMQAAYLAVAPRALSLPLRL